MGDPVTMGLMAGGTLLEAKGKIDTGNAAAEESKIEAAQMRAVGRDQFAQGTRASYQSSKDVAAFLSDQRAAMAGSGGVTTDAGAINELSRTAQRGKFNVLNELYKGRQLMANADAQAAGTLYQGQQKRKAGRLAAAGSLLSGASSIYSHTQDFKRDAKFAKEKAKMKPKTAASK